MKELDFKPVKSTDKFRSNYKLHDLAEYQGMNLFTQWGINSHQFGEDNRFKRVWERGEDKPDVIIKYKNFEALIDWKGKHKAKWIVNERAVKAYEEWAKALEIKVFIIFFVFDNESKLIKRKFASLSDHKYSLTATQWDKNSAIRFQDDLPEFTKANFLKFLGS